MMVKKFDETSNIVQWFCTQCERTYPASRSSNLKDHIEANHITGLAIPCDICYKTFATSASHRMHMRKHLKQDPYHDNNSAYKIDFSAA